MREMRTTTVSGSDTAHSMQSAPPGRENQVRVAGGRGSVGQGSQGARALKRRTARKQRRASLQRFTAWCQEHRHLRLPGRFQRLNATLRGYDNSYGVHGNAASLQECFNKALRMLL